MPPLPPPARLRHLAAALACVASPALADPGYYVVTPYDNEGLRIVDFRYWTVKPDDHTEVVWPEVGFGYGVTSRWTTELFASWIGSSHMATSLSSWNWQNDFLLTQGQWPVDIALHTQLVRTRGDAAETLLEFGPVLQTDVGRTQITGNLFLERTLTASPRRPMELKYQWQLRHRWMRGLHVGAQGFGELGPWNDWAPHAQQSHRAGPALFTSLSRDGGATYKVQAAYLVGRTYARRGHMFTLRAHAEF